MAKRGRPRKFEGDGKECIDLYQTFNDEVKDDGFKIVPTQSEFCRWLGKNFEETDRRTIYNYLNKYFPAIKKEFEQILSDTIAAGAMLGKYNSTMTIFALKNWCHWGDVAQTETKTAEDDPLTKALKGVADELKRKTAENLT